MHTVEASTTTARVAVGLLAAAMGVGSFVVLSVQPTLEFRISEYMSVYTKYEWFLAAVLVVAGLVLAAVGRLSALAASCAAIVAAQLGSAGGGAFKQWYSFFGPTGWGSSHHDALELLALVMAGLCLVAALACIWFLAQCRAFARGATSGPVRVALVAVGVVIIVGLPIALSVDDNSTGVETLLAFGLLYSLPWGIAVIVASWLSEETALGVCSAVVLLALVAAASEHFISMGSHTASAYIAVAALAAAAGVLRSNSAGWDRTRRGAMSVDS